MDLDDAALVGFAPVACASCGGVLKPDVVFFGETVPPDRVRTCFELVGGGAGRCSSSVRR